MSRQSDACFRVILAGDFSRLPCRQIATKCSLQLIVRCPTCGARILDIIYVSESSYAKMEVVEPRVNSDHKAVVAFIPITATSAAICAQRCCVIGVLSQEMGARNVTPP